MALVSIDPLAPTDQPVAIFDAATEAWENASDRVPVFAIRRPNPDYDAQLAEYVAPRAHDGSSDAPLPDIGPEPLPYVDTPFTMPARVNPSFGIAIAARARRGYSMDDIFGWVIEVACGTAALEALVEDVSALDADEQRQVIRTISQRVQRIAAGTLPKETAAS